MFIWFSIILQQNPWASQKDPCSPEVELQLMGQLPSIFPPSPQVAHWSASLDGSCNDHIPMKASNTKEILFYIPKFCRKPYTSVAWTFQKEKVKCWNQACDDTSTNMKGSEDNSPPSLLWLKSCTPQPHTHIFSFFQQLHLQHHYSRDISRYSSVCRNINSL